MDTYPTYGYVWFEGDENAKRAAVIYGTTNGAAIAVMEEPDARILLNSSRDVNRVTCRGNYLYAHIPSMGETLKLPVNRAGMVLFDGGWSLLHEVTGGRPSRPLSAAWRKRVNFDRTA